MKTIILNIDDDVLKSLQTAMSLKKMVGGFYGMLDAALEKIIQSIDKNEETVTLKFKDQKEKSNPIVYKITGKEGEIR